MKLKRSFVPIFISIFLFAIQNSQANPRLFRANTDETSFKFKRVKSENREQIDSKIREKFEALINDYPGSKLNQEQFEIVFCVDRNFKINHIFWLGLKGTSRELLTEILISMQDDDLLMLPDFFFTAKNEVDIRFSYPTKGWMDSSFDQLSKSEESKVKDAILIYQLNQIIRKRLSEFLIQEKIPQKKIVQFSIEFQANNSGQFEVSSISENTKLSQEAKKIMESLPSSLVPTTSDQNPRNMKKFQFSYPRPSYTTRLNFHWGHPRGWSYPPEDLNGNSTPSYKEYKKRRPKLLED